MGSKQIRLGQIIAPFGPGSIYTDRRGTPHIVCGLDHWFKRWDQTRGLVRCQDPEEFERFEPRLAALLNVGRFCAPPDFRIVRFGQTAPPNAQALYSSVAVSSLVSEHANRRDASIQSRQPAT